MSPTVNDFENFATKTLELPFLQLVSVVSFYIRKKKCFSLIFFTSHRVEMIILFLIYPLVPIRQEVK